MTALSRPATKTVRKAAHPGLSPGWWLIPSIVGGACIWLWLGIVLVRWLF